MTTKTLAKTTQHKETCVNSANTHNRRILRTKLTSQESVKNKQ